MPPLVECVANVSEGRDLGVIDKLKTALTTIQGVHVLDQHRDEDHHRCVLTFAGTDESVGEAAVAVAAKAVEFINLTRHVGRHPRIGATDVVPMIPLAGATMAQCVRLARRVGARIGEELQIPVFLYEEACDRSFRKRLEQIRNGGVEALTRRMQTDPGLGPGFRPCPTTPDRGRDRGGGSLSVDCLQRDVRESGRVRGPGDCRNYSRRSWRTSRGQGHRSGTEKPRMRAGVNESDELSPNARSRGV